MYASSDDETKNWDDFLAEAVSARDQELVRGALAQGGNPNAGAWGDRDTILFYAVFGGDRDIVRLLLEAGGNVAAERSAESTSLHAAAEHKDLLLAQMLLEADGRAALDWFDYIGRTPLMCAVQNEDLAMARLLLAAGADVNARDVDHAGNTALHIAAANGSVEMVGLLVDAGADPTVRGGMGLTPLDKARSRKKPEGRQICALLEDVAARRPVRGR